METTRHTLIAGRTARPDTLTVVGSFDTDHAAVDEWRRLDDARIDALRLGVHPAADFYAVREDGHPMVDQARVNDAALTPRQATALDQLDQALTRRAGRPIRPGTDPSWRGMYSTDLVRPALALQAKGLVRVDGVPYGPKTYRVTGDGHKVARALRSLQAAA